MNDLLANLSEPNSTSNQTTQLSAQPMKPAASIEWRFATNHLNLLMMLAMGMISEPKAIGKKYAQDSLSIHPGFLPLFPKPMPKSVLNYSVEQHPDLLKACILSFNKNKLGQWLNLLPHTKVPAWNGQNLQWLDMLQDDFNQIICVLIPTPLPIALIEKIMFQHKEDLQAYTNRLDDTNNVIQHIPTTVTGTEFKTIKRTEVVSVENLKRSLPPIASSAENQPLTMDNSSLQANRDVPTTPLANQANTEVVENDLSKHNIPLASFANACGATLAYLSWLANTNLKTNELLTSIKTDSVETLQDSLLKDIGLWLTHNGNYHSQSMTNESFLLLMTAIISQKSNPQFASTKDIILDQLQQIARRSEASLEFITDLTSLATFPSETVLSLFGKHTKPFARSVILFFSQPDITSLWHVNQSVQFKGHMILDDMTILLATLLFAVSDGWLSLSTEVKTYANNSLTIANIMAQIAHGTSLAQDNHYLSQFNLSLLQTLLEENWKPAHNNLAIAIAKQYAWQCVSTKISLPKNTQLTVEKGQVCVNFEGDDYKLITDVDKQRFFGYLNQLPILPFDIEQSLRLKFEKNFK